MPLVTIGIPFYKDRDTLEFAILSTLNQIYQDWELILVDDGSTDGSLEIARKFEKMDSRIHVISDGCNKKLPARLNEIVSLAKGKYIARMDADDIMHPERIAKEVEYLEKNTQVDVVGTDAYSIDLENHILGLKKIPRIPDNIEDVFRAAIFIHPSIMGKTSWFKKNKYDERRVERAEDYELWCRTFKTSCFKLIEEPLYFCREGSSIIKSVDNQLKTYDSVLWVLHNYCRKYCGTSFAKKLALNIQIKKLIYKFGFSLGVLNIILPKILNKRYILIDDREKEQAKTLLMFSIREQ